MSSLAHHLMGKLLSKRKKTSSSARPSSSSSSSAAVATTTTAAMFGGAGGGDGANLQESSTSCGAVQHMDAVVSVAAVRSGLCLSGSKDKSVVLYDYKNGRQIDRFTGHTNAVTKVCYGSVCAGVFSASRDNTVRMWRTGERQCLREYTGHSLVVTALHICSDNSYLCSGSRDNSVKLWDVETGSCVRSKIIAQNLVTDVKFVPGTSMIVQTGEDKELRVFDVRTLEPVASFPKKQYIQMCCDVHPDGQHVLSSSNGFSGNGCEASLWDLRTRKLKLEFKGHTEAVEACLFLPGFDCCLVTASRDCSVRTWNMLAGSCECEHYFSLTGPLTSLAAYSNGTLLVGSFKQGVLVMRNENKSLRHVMSF